MKILLVVLLLFHLKSFSQTDSLKGTLFNNDSIRYEVIRKADKVTPSSVAKVSVNYIKIEMPQKTRKYLLTLKNELWQPQRPERIFR